MAKKKPLIQFNVSTYRDEPFVIYFVEIDSGKGTTTEPIEKSRHSEHMYAHNTLAGIFDRMKNATFENSTIIQQNERNPNISWKWYIEDERH